MRLPQPPQLPNAGTRGEGSSDDDVIPRTTLRDIRAAPSDAERRRLSDARSRHAGAAFAGQTVSKSGGRMAGNGENMRACGVLAFTVAAHGNNLALKRRDLG